MIISDFYQTKIEVVKSDTTTSYYNVNIDATDVQVIVSLIDFNGAPVVGKSVTLNCDNGYFTKYGSGTSTSSLTATGNTTTKNITATTDSNGKISATYTASEWGLATFSTNTQSVQIRVNGWRTYYNDTNYTINYNETLVQALIHTGSINITGTWNGFHTILNDDFIRPSSSVIGIDYTGQAYVIFNSAPNKRIEFKTIYSNTITMDNFHTNVLWRKK